jgi:NADP-dependent 3-hydroxy acid dehydrogenase YdfG
MRTALKPLSSQVVVITGATSGVGLATARLASARGAKLLLVARNGQALRSLCEELKARGGIADHHEADVADLEALRAAATKAESLYGGFDTWVNNAGVSIVGRIDETPIEDQRRLFETNYWGVVNGSRVAVAHLKSRPEGGALITVGSVLSDQAIPTQGVYSASKHAVRGFINALRMELRAEAPGVSVTLIKPSALDTPSAEHARNLTDGQNKNPPPVYAAPLAAEAILYAAETPVREITVGGGGRLLALFGQHFPLLAEPIFAWAIPKMSRGLGDKSQAGEDALHKPGRDLRERIPYLGVRQTSLYTTAQMNPRVSAAVLVGAGALMLAVLKARASLKLHQAKRDAVRRYRAKVEAAARRTEDGAA